MVIEEESNRETVEAVKEGVASIALLPCGSISGHFIQLPHSICYGLHGTGTFSALIIQISSSLCVCVCMCIASLKFHFVGYICNWVLFRIPFSTFKIVYKVLSNINDSSLGFSRRGFLCLSTLVNYMLLTWLSWEISCIFYMRLSLKNTYPTIDESLIFCFFCFP